MLNNRSGQLFRQSLQAMHFSGSKCRRQSGGVILNAPAKQADAQLPQWMHRLSS